MKGKSKGLAWMFLVCLAGVICVPPLWSNLRLNFFAPFLILSYYKTSFRKALWLSLSCGLVLDLLSSSTRFGHYACIYTFTSAILYNKHQQFFEDHLTTIPVMTFLFSFLSTLIGIPLQGDFNIQGLLADLIAIPFSDACYAFIFFNLPFILVSPRQRRAQDYFLNRSR